jgi:hypothetical protein
MAPPKRKRGQSSSSRSGRPQSDMQRRARNPRGSQAGPSPRNSSSESASPGLTGKLRKLFSSLVWQGITGILTLLSIGVSIGLVFYTQHIQDYAQSLQKQASIANMTLTTTYLYDGSDQWTMNVDVSNDGPAVASAVHLSYSALHTTCMVDELTFSSNKRTKVVTKSVKQDLQCPDGSILVGAVPAKSLAGLFVHPLTSYSANSAMGLFSGIAYGVYPGEDIFVYLNFKVTPDLNSKLMAELPTKPLTIFNG